MAEQGFSKTVVLAMTGASGAKYGLRLLQALVAANCKVYFLLSDAGKVVLETETPMVLPEALAEQQSLLQGYCGAVEGQISVLEKNDWMSPVASGSSSVSSMVICPCSGGTLSSIASGASNNLIERAADVALKERRQLIVVPREAPYSEVHLENMLKLTRMGAVVIPASPGFYHKPQTVGDLVDFIVARIMDQLGLEQQLLARWGEG